MTAQCDWAHAATMPSYFCLKSQDLLKKINNPEKKKIQIISRDVSEKEWSHAEPVQKG